MMIVYLDTTSLMKLYVEEDGSSKVDVLVKSSEFTATPLVAYAKAKAAFARRFREKELTSEERQLIKKFFIKDGSGYLVLCY